MAKAFVKTFKRDYVSVNPIPDSETVIAQLLLWFEYSTLFTRTRHWGIGRSVSSLNRRTEI